MSEEQIKLKTNAPEIRTKVNRVLRAIKDHYSEHGEDFELEELEKAIANPPNKPSFPIIMLPLAVLKDVADYVFTLISISVSFTGVGLIFVVIFIVIYSVVYSIMLFFWSVFKIKHQKFKRWFIRLFVTFVVELIYGFDLIPANTVYVLYVYNREKKIVMLLDYALNKLKESKVLDHIEKE